MYKAARITSATTKHIQVFPRQLRTLQTTIRMSAPQGSDSAKPGLVAAHAQYVKGQAVVSFYFQPEQASVSFLVQDLLH